MKNLLLLFLLFVLVLTVVGQEDSVSQKTSLNNQIDLDVQVLGVDFLYKHRIAKKLFLGIGFGGGAITSFSNKGLIFEIIESKLILDYCPSDKVHFYAGPKFFGLVLTEDNKVGAKLFGVELGLFFRVKKIEFGAEFSLISSSTLFNRSKAALMLTPLIVKIPLGRW